MKLKSHFKLTGKLTSIFLITIILTANGLKSVAQQDTIKNYKNTIRFNLTNPMFFGYKSIIFGYERQLKNSQSFSINLGRAYFGEMSIINEDSLSTDVSKDSKDKGFNISGDYRWYLKKENKFEAPHGLYIGPYCSYNYFNRINNWTINTETYNKDVQSELTMNIGTIGFEMGYQFMLGKRFALDMIMFGPGIGNYKIKTILNTELSSEEEKLLYDKINNFLEEKIPGYNQVLDGSGIQRSGSTNTWGTGYRFMIMIGYRF
jgi:hypothetical protein